MAASTPSRSIEDLLRAGTAHLSEFEDAAFDAEFLLRGVSGLSRAEVLAHGDRPMPADVVTRFDDAIERRRRHEPMQYILGVASFWRDDFVVNPAVLIPRTETEILVEAVATRLRDHAAPTVLDLGTGSGCIVLSLLRELPRANAVAVDLSHEALAVASENAARLDLSNRIALKPSCWYSGLDSDQTFDAIVSNPPYVAVTDKKTLPRDVREYEPALALFADEDDDISSYRAIVHEMGNRLRSAGLLALEVGMGQSDRVADLLRAAGFVQVEALPDFASIQRVVLGRRA